MSKPGISTQQARRDNLNTLDSYINNLVRTKTDWPRNAQTGEISILAIELDIKRSGKSFSRKYLQIPKGNRKDVFTDRFLLGMEEVRSSLETGAISSVPKPLGKKIAPNADELPPIKPDIHKKRMSDPKALEILKKEISNNKEEISMLKKLIAQYDLIETIGIATGKSIIPHATLRVLGVRAKD